MKRFGLLLILVSSFGVGCAAGTERHEKTSPKERLALLLLGPSDSCEGNKDCPSHVCHNSVCVSVTEARQDWMLANAAEALQGLVRQTPDLMADVTHTYVPRMVEADPYIQARLAGLLGHFGDARFVPLLRRLGRSESQTVRHQALLALGKLGDSESLADVRRLLEHRSLTRVLHAIGNLPSYLSGSHRSAVLADLVRLIGHENYSVRQAAVRTLARSAPLSMHESGPALAALRAIIEDPSDGFLQYDAVRAYVALAPKKFDEIVQVAERVRADTDL